MKKTILLMMAVLAFTTTICAADNHSTSRVMQICNDKVNVWKTTVYPSVNQTLKMHRHDHDRVVVALNDGTLKITNNNGKIHYWRLKKSQSYFLTKDIAGELHSDENITSTPLKVIVIELKD